MARTQVGIALVCILSLLSPLAGTIASNIDIFTACPASLFRQFLQRTCTREIHFSPAPWRWTL